MSTDSGCTDVVGQKERFNAKATNTVCTNTVCYIVCVALT